jgi:hypothetical protein
VRVEEELPRASAEQLVLVLARPAPVPNVIAGRVIDASGSPVEGARVGFGIETTRTDDTGSFRFDRDDPQSMNARQGVEPTALIAALRGALPARYEPPLAADGTRAWPRSVVLKLGELPLSIAGEVVDDRGEPLAGVRVWLDDATLLGVGERGLALVENVLAGHDKLWRSVETDERGRFEIDGLAQREYTLQAMDPDTLLRVKAGPFPAGARDARLALPTDELHPRVAGRIVGSDGTPIAKARVMPMCDAFQVRLNGAVASTSHSRLQGAVTDAEGRFELRNVPKSLVYLRIEGEDLIPLEYGRYVEGDSRFERVSVRALPAERIEALEIAVERRCHLQVRLADPELADAVAVLDAAGDELMLNVFVGTGRREQLRAPLAEGRSDPLAVSDAARTLVLYKGAAEVGRKPLELTPGELTEVGL